MADTREKKTRCIVSTRLNWQEKESLINVSRKLDIPYCSITRQLIRYVLQGQLMWLDLLRRRLIRSIVKLATCSLHRVFNLEIDSFRRRGNI